MCCFIWCIPDFCMPVLSNKECSFSDINMAVILCQESRVCNGNVDCPDKSDEELCDDPCAPDSFTGKYTMKVRV